MLFGRKPPSTDEARIEELLTRGVAEIIPGKESMRKLLASGKRLRIKLGFDPTGEKIHIGHSAPLLKLRDFQSLGHTVVFIVGDFTAVIGDTSDKESERPMLANDVIRKNMAEWKSQVGKILDLSQAEFRYNSAWLSKLTYREIGEHADAFSVSDFIARENIKRRLDEGKRVSLREVLYPLMQGYDSVAVNADVEIGGTDQRFNLLAGRTLQEKHRQPPQHVLTLPLMTDSTGKKLSKTGGATVYITDEPTEMFGKVMSVPDELVRQYYISMTRAPLPDVEKALTLHPKETKMSLAEEIVRMYHGESAAGSARHTFDVTFSKKEIPDDIQAVEVPLTMPLVEILLDQKIVSSRSEYSRLEKAGAIEILSERVELRAPVPTDGLPSKVETVRVGKRRFLRIYRR